MSMNESIFDWYPSSPEHSSLGGSAPMSGHNAETSESFAFPFNSFTPPLTAFNEGKHKKKKKKKKKSKRAKEIGKKNTQITLSNTVLQSLIDDHCRLAAESAALQKENDMMRRMMYLAVAANHKTLRSEYIETGMEVLGNGKRL